MRAHAVLLQHFPLEEEETLKADSRWEGARAKRSGLILAQMIRDASHNVIKHKNSAILAVEAKLMTLQ